MTNLYVPCGIDVGPVVSPALAIMIDLALIAAFGIQHSVMARPAFKSVLVRYWRAAIERNLHVAHLLFSTGMTVYILIGVRYEERDLRSHMGSVYVEYSKRVGMVVPRLGKSQD